MFQLTINNKLHTFNIFFNFVIPMFKAFILLLLKICTPSLIAEGRDKLTKMLIYSLKLLDSIKSAIRDQPTYRMERIGSKPLLK